MTEAVILLCLRYSENFTGKYLRRTLVWHSSTKTRTLPEVLSFEDLKQLLPLICEILFCLQS